MALFATLPEWLSHVFTVFFGLVIGSFLNVVVVRLPRRKSLMWPGSHCPKCRKEIRWYDNIPVLSYLLLRGKCRKCHARISIRYPVIEIITALLFLATQLRWGWSPMLFIRDWPFVAILIAVTFIDLEHRIIPDVLSKGGLVLGLATSWAVPEVGWKLSLIGAMVGFGFFYLLAWSYQAMNRRAGLGGGDIKLLAMLGAFLGPQGVFVTVLISSVMGSLVGILWAYFQGKRNLMKVAIPYGPFLVLGGLYYYLLGDIEWFQFTTPM